MTRSQIPNPNFQIPGGTWLLVLLLAGCTTAERGRQRGDAASFARAGNPDCVAKWAVPSDTGSYIGYQVGGGSANCRKAEEPASHEGTWGWDYEGRWWPSRVVLGWWHGREQGGTGAYKTDGPRPVEAIERRHE